MMLNLVPQFDVRIRRVGAGQRRAMVTCAAFVVLATFVSAWSAWADVADHDQQFVQGLRQRRLFSLAEAFCLRQLAAPQLAADDAGHWSIELIRVYSDQAVNSIGSARDASWQDAAKIARQFEVEHPDHPRLPLVQVQAALALLAQGELARMEAEVGTSSEQAIAVARTTIRESARQLEAIDEHLTNAIPLAARNARKSRALTAAELSSLQQNVRYQWARALRNQALCYPAGSADRLAALTQTVRMLEQPLQVLPADDPLVARIRIDQSICHRLLGDGKMAAAALSGLDAQQQPPEIRLMARAESLRLLLAANQVDPALKALNKGRAIEGVDSADLDFASLEVYIAKWRESGNKATDNDSTDWEQKSVAALEFIEQAHGPYWARRGELLLASANLQTGSGNVSILDRAARDMYLKGRLDEAVVAYDKAVEAARSDDDQQQAFGLAYKAALIQQQRKLHGDARRRFRELALSNHENPLAQNAHLLAIVNLAQEAKADPDLLTNYATLLSEHLTTWPQSETTDTAHLWLGQLHEARQEWESAVQHFSAIKTTSDEFPLAVSASTRCWSAWLAARQAGGEPVQEIGEAAVRYCDAVLRRNDSKLPQQWNAIDGECLIHLARIQLKYLRSDTEPLQQLLRLAIDNSDASATWRNTAQSLLVLAVLRKPNGQQEAQTLLSEILFAENGDTSTEQLLELLAGVEQAAADAPDLAASVGTLERDIADRLLRPETNLDATQQRRVAMIRAAALVKLGDTDAALDAYAELADQYKDQASVQVAYAELLLASEKPGQLRLALTQWRRVASRTKPRTTRWFRAKYSVALAQFKLGEKDAAGKLIRYLQATEDLAASGLQREFQKLLERCQ